MSAVREVATEVLQDKTKNTLKNRLERLIMIPAISLLVLFIPRSATIITDLAWPLVSVFDPEKVFLWVTIHHVLTLAFTVLVMKFVLRIDFRQWGFNLNELPETLRDFGRFVLVYFGVIILLHLHNIISGTAPSFGYPLTTKNMAGVLGFQLLLPGPVEEPLYRGMVMIVLGKYLKGMHRIGVWEIPSSGLVATGLFMVAHVGFTFSPFVITSFSLLNLIGALVLGFYLAHLFYKSGSLLGPIITHSYGNVILKVVSYSMAFMFR
jgi:hypothetical protein